jgi:hypothetical protein
MWISLGATAALGAVGWLWAKHRSRRRSIYRELSQLRQLAAQQGGPRWGLPAVDDEVRARFNERRILRVGETLLAEDLAALQVEAVKMIPQLERSYIPGHKQGGTICYERLLRSAPRVIGLFQSELLRSWLSDLVGQVVYPTPVSDQSSCSLLVYNQAGDRIGWHYDHNFYRGRHFTVLINLINTGSMNGLSTSQLQQQHQDGRVDQFDTSQNTLVVFEGARVRHCATASSEGDLRMMLSMTFCTDPRTGPLKEAARRVKETAFYGLRALWD